jgi:hypothetical protein
MRVPALSTSVLILLCLLQPIAAQVEGEVNTWSPTGSMSMNRSQHTATLLPDGRVLVSGGLSEPRGASAEIYDPALGTWSPTGSMSTSRYTHTATLLPDGRVVVSGGRSGSLVVASAEIYDPALGTWSPTGSMSTGRSQHTATLLPDGRVLVSGGCCLFGPLASAEIYDPALGTWSPTGSMSTSRHVHSATLLTDSRVLVSGGFSGVYLGSSEIYDPALGTWSPTGSMSTSRHVHSATLLTDSRVLVSGGLSGSLVVASAEIYDPALGTWSPTDSMSTSRYIHSATLLSDGQVLVSGGVSLASAEIYDPALGTWSPTGSMSTSRYTHTATLLPDGRVLVSGGGITGASAEIYSSAPPPNTDSGTDVSVNPPVTLPDGTTASISLTFDSVETTGETTVTASSQGPPPPSGFKLTNPPVYYEITTTATFSGTVRVCLSWTEGQIANESNVEMFHYENNQWVNITDPTSRDTVNNTVCGTTNSFSPFTLVEVKYPFTGFFQPVGNPPTVNAVKAGAAVPVKFSLGGDVGLNILATGYPRVQLMQCVTGETIASVEETVNAGGSSLSYDAVTGIYTYVWKTDQAWANSCRELQLMLNDGEVYKARFTMRR